MQEAPPGWQNGLEQFRCKTKIELDRLMLPKASSQVGRPDFMVKLAGNTQKFDSGGMALLPIGWPKAGELRQISKNIKNQLHLVANIFKFQPF